jgi:hypothetical protein
MKYFFLFLGLIRCAQNPSSDLNAGDPLKVPEGMAQTLSAPSGQQALPVIPIPCLQPQSYIANSQDLAAHLAQHHIDPNSSSGQYFAFAHFLTHGFRESRSGHSCGNLSSFNEESYLNANSDVREGLQGKIIAPGLTHWIYFGQAAWIRIR